MDQQRHNFAYFSQKFDVAVKVYMRKKDSELFENIPERGTGGNVSPEIEKTQVEYKREVCFLWPQEAEPGSKMLYECDLS